MKKIIAVDFLQLTVLSIPLRIRNFPGAVAWTALGNAKFRIYYSVHQSKRSLMQKNKNKNKQLTDFILLK